MTDMTEIINSVRAAALAQVLTDHAPEPFLTEADLARAVDAAAQAALTVILAEIEAEKHRVSESDRGYWGIEMEALNRLATRLREGVAVEPAPPTPYGWHEEDWDWAYAEYDGRPKDGQK